MVAKTRRNVLGLCVSGTIAMLAGCGGDSGDESGRTRNNGDSDGADGDGGTGTDPSETTTDDGTSNGSGSQLGETVTFPDSFAMTATQSMEGQTVEMNGRFNQGNIYWEFTQQGQTVEMYIVDDTSYFVRGGQCITGMQQSFDRDNVNPGRFDEEAAANQDVEPSGTETINGEEVLVYEVSEATAGQTDGTVTYYVLSDSGYIRRIESDSMEMNFHSWGEVESISEPDMDCQSMSGDGMTTPGG